MSDKLKKSDTVKEGSSAQEIAEKDLDKVSGGSSRDEFPPPPPPPVHFKP